MSKQIFMNVAEDAEHFYLVTYTTFHQAIIRANSYEEIETILAKRLVLDGWAKCTEEEIAEEDVVKVWDDYRNCIPLDLFRITKLKNTRQELTLLELRAFLEEQFYTGEGAPDPIIIQLERERLATYRPLQLTPDYWTDTIILEADEAMDEVLVTGFGSQQPMEMSLVWDLGFADIICGRFLETPHATDFHIGYHQKYGEVELKRNRHDRILVSTDEHDELSWINHEQAVHDALSRIKYTVITLEVK